MLFSQRKERIDDRQVLDLLWQYMRRAVYDDGMYEDIKRGISLGRPLSPLMGALRRRQFDGHFGCLRLTGEATSLGSSEYGCLFSSVPFFGGNHHR